MSKELKFEDFYKRTYGMSVEDLLQLGFKQAKKIEILTEAVEYYAGKDVYNNPWKMCQNHYDNATAIEEDDWEHDPWDEDYMTSWGGKKAREVLEKIKTLENKEE